jgi:hypothetical protein
MYNHHTASIHTVMTDLPSQHLAHLHVFLLCGMELLNLSRCPRQTTANSPALSHSHTWTCLLTQRSGTHDTYKHHAQHCGYCSPERKEAIREENEANKENRIAAVEEDEKGQSAVHHRSHILLPPAVNTYRHDDLSHADFSLDSPQWPWKEWGADEVTFIQMTGLKLD